MFQGAEIELHTFGNGVVRGGLSPRKVPAQISVPSTDSCGTIAIAEETKDFPNLISITLHLACVAQRVFEYIWVPALETLHYVNNTLHRDRRICFEGCWMGVGL